VVAIGDSPRVAWKQFPGRSTVATVLFAPTGVYGLDELSLGCWFWLSTPAGAGRYTDKT
jgi:hypothetical protein